MVQMCTRCAGAQTLNVRACSRCNRCRCVQWHGEKGIKEEVEVSDYSPERGFPRRGAQGGRQGRQPHAIQGGVSYMASFSVVNNIASANAQANLATTNSGRQLALNRSSS